MTACRLQPVDDRIVAREIPAEAVTAYGLALPFVPSGPIRAKVLAVGPGRRVDSGALIPPPAQVGDVVLLAEHGPTEIDLDGEVLLCAPPMLVLAVESDDAICGCAAGNHFGPPPVDR